MMETFGTDFYSEFHWPSLTVEFTELFPYDESAISAPLDNLFQIDLAEKEPQQDQKPVPEPLYTTTIANIPSPSEEGTSGTCTLSEVSTPPNCDPEPAEYLPEEPKTSVQGTSRTSTALKRSTTTSSAEDLTTPPPPAKKRKSSVRPPATSRTKTKRVPIRICGVDGCKKEIYHTGDFERHLQTQRHGGGKSSCIRDFGCICSKPLEGSRRDAVIRHVKNVREAAEKKRLELLGKENRGSSF